MCREEGEGAHGAVEGWARRGEDVQRVVNQIRWRVWPAWLLAAACRGAVTPLARLRMLQQ